MGLEQAQVQSRNQTLELRAESLKDQDQGEAQAAFPASAAVEQAAYIRRVSWLGFVVMVVVVLGMKRWEEVRVSLVREQMGLMVARLAERPVHLRGRLRRRRVGARMHVPT